MTGIVVLNLTAILFYKKKNIFLLQNTASSDCMSKTLDSASAHFAASAVVNTPNNENRPQFASVNGVLPNSGKCNFMALKSKILSSSIAMF